MQLVSLPCSEHRTSEGGGGVKSTGFCILPVVFGRVSDSYDLAVTGAKMLEVGQSFLRVGAIVATVPGMVGGSDIFL